ncbi:regulator of nonsense transcripts 3B-like [Rhopilema esculentum]|uniref:regulator of nonsense transcripts 3B-like n=1 Tax=Rhopilema esculentum TaxID=499914 RepID=UPI0031DC0ACD
MAMGKLEGSEKSQSKSKKKEKELLPTKLVIRRLPASLTEADLKEIFVGIPEHDHFRFVSPDYSLYPHSFARAYINFKRFEDVTLFRNKFDGFIFNAGKGDESSAVVEVAPFQAIPRENRKRKDVKNGSITKDPDYEAFLENLSKKVEPLPSAEIYVEQMESTKAAGSKEKSQTPLVEFLNKKKAAKNVSRQNALENERRMRREKESGRDSKFSNDDRYSEDSKRDKKDANSETKGSQDKRENKRKEERRERRGNSGKKNRHDQRDQKDSRDLKSRKQDDDDKPLSARSDTSGRRSEGRINKREDRRQSNERRNRDERKEDKNQRRADDQKKTSRTEQMKQEEQRPRRKSIEYEDPSIVAFGKSVETSKEYGKKTQGNDGVKGKEVADKSKGEEQDKWKSKEHSRGNNQVDDGDKKVKNKERPAMAIYRPPVARHDRNKAKDDRSSPDKGRVKSPTGTKSPEKKERPQERGYNKDRPRSYNNDREYDRDRNKEKERRNREQERREREREREREKRKEKDRAKEGTMK